jgi:hypothetical protein
MSDYVNRVYDPGGGGGFVRWTTTSPDTGGGSYPDPHGTTFGGTFDYCVETVFDPPGGSTIDNITCQLTNDEGASAFQGEAVYSNGDGTFGLALADDPATSKAIGIVADASIADAAAGAIAKAGTVDIPPAARGSEVWAGGEEIYVSASTAGDLTNVVPTLDGEVEASVGICLTDATAVQTATLRLNIKPTILLEHESVTV